MQRRRIVILGAAGRDFHDFNVLYREDPSVEVVAFTATQIPNIEQRRYPPELAGPLYPDGVPIHPEDSLEELISREGVDEVVFAYSDVSHMHVMHLAARAVAAGASFSLPGAATMLDSHLPVVAVTATRTGAGKSPTSRRVRRILAGQGLRVAVIRHPMPYGDLVLQRSQRFTSVADLDAADVTIEEREEYEPHLQEGAEVYAGADYRAILADAESRTDFVLWDGGNNDLPFIRPDLHICVADPHRAGHELEYWPGEANFRRADVVVINKVDTAPAGSVDRVAAHLGAVNPNAILIKAASPITVEGGASLAGKRVLVVEDGPTITHGGMGFGAGTLAARRYGAAELIDPRPFAVGSLVDVFNAFPHIGPALPAMGYGEQQIGELRDTIERAHPDMVVVGTPIDLARLLGLEIPAVRAGYEVEEIEGPSLAGIITATFFPGTGS